MFEKYQNMNRIDQTLLESYQVRAFRHFMNDAINNDIDDFEDYKNDIDIVLHSVNTIQCVFNAQNIDYVLFYNSEDQESAYVYRDNDGFIEYIDNVDLGFLLDNSILNGVSVKYIHKDFVEYIEFNDYLNDNLKRIQFEEDSFKMFNYL